MCSAISSDTLAPPGTQTDNPAHPTSLTFRTSAPSGEGFMSAYDGLGAGCTRQIFYATSRFGLFETFRDKIHEIRGTLGPAER